MSVKVEVRLDADSLADFMIHNVYVSAVGILAMALGVLNIGLSVAFAVQRKYLYMLLFIGFTILIVVVLPYFVRKNVKKKMEGSRRTKETVTYEFTENGIITTTTEDSGRASWSKFKKAISKKYILVLYADNKQAIILPINQLGDKYPDVVDMIYAHMPAPAVRIRRPDKK